MVKCVKCSSEEVVADKKGFGAGKALVGGLLLGPIGLLGGCIGSNKIKVACLNCGHSWEVKNNKLKQNTY